MLELVPSSGHPLHASDPDGPLRIVAFGARGHGLVVYLVLDEQRRVEVLQVAWMSP